MKELANPTKPPRIFALRQRYRANAYGKINLVEKVYKDYAVDTQMQLLEFNKELLLKERERESTIVKQREEINRMKVLMGETVDVRSSTPPPSPSQSQKSISEDALKEVLAQWNKKLRENVAVKTEAMAEAQIHLEAIGTLKKEAQKVSGGVMVRVN